jgi:bifunctional N-acetylglucosamine-1-phosphate-uridyltransferase/glucosamine-1-phosphate-acetyltransferase GlmU-like protein
LLGVIAAGGKGTRMNSYVPKPLTKTSKGETFLDLQINKLLLQVDELIIIVSQEVMNHPDFIKDKNCDYLVQESPTGMGDAVFVAADYISQHEDIVILWADQVGLTKETILNSIDLHRTKSSHQKITIPVIKKNDGYIDLCFKGNELEKVLQAREGDLISPPNLSDVGFFCISTNGVLVNEWFHGGREYSRGKVSGEYNLLPFFAYLSGRGWGTQVLNATHLDGFGVNTHNDLIRLNQELDK